MSLSKSTKRRKCLKGSEELNLAIESNNVFNSNHRSVVCQSARTSLEHDVGNVSNSITTKSTANDESNYYTNDHGSNLMVDINFDNNILIPNFSSDSDNSSDCDNNKNVLTNIKSWAVQHKISHIALSNLLKVLKTNHNCFHYFPNDSRTLLKTNVSKQPLQIQTINPGTFYYFEVVNGIKSCIDKNTFSDDTIKLHIGIDGLPLTKSTNSQFWPILCCIRNFNSIHPCVFLVGLYWGHEKPLESNMYLSQLVTELINLCTNGIDLSSGKKKVVVEAFSCDAPAMSYILKIKGHTGFSSCTRCKTVGVFLERRVCFPENYPINLETIYMSADCPLPIDNEIDLNILEDKTLGDLEFKNNLIHELSCVGGKHLKAAVKRIMSKLFTNSFLSMYSFSGKKGKKKFCDLFILPIIIKSIKKQLKFKNTSDHEIEEPIKIYLAQTPFADRNKK